MQAINLTETNFRVEYHKALKNINVNSTEVLEKLWEKMTGNAVSTGSNVDDLLPTAIKIVKKKKM
jgi:hypothetical protein